jgi:hypothetical protein
MKLTVNQLRRIIKEEVQKVIGEAPVLPATKSDSSIESLAKKTFIDNDSKSELKLVRQLKKQFRDDGYAWEQTLLDVLGDDYEDSVSDFVDAYAQDM